MIIFPGQGRSKRDLDSSLQPSRREHIVDSAYRSVAWDDGGAAFLNGTFTGLDAGWGTPPNSPFLLALHQDYGGLIPRESVQRQ